ncbi:hypothetical protein PILCRDRAFT_819851 [Piloderma croceum F 1598]|uniref:Peptidase A1 domain-containing protein n=1 Tax=Piloderma croceum (strain F 1598) TaxID=765440 RepID=A0A0C3FWV8_PILCF|nr:hypothetical protein PILCRDRAFT_819851 [Piloderma croceum F 1598]
MTPVLLLVAALLVSAHAYGEREPSYNIRRVAPLTSAALATEVLPAAQFFVPLTEKVPRQTYKKKLLEALRTGLSTTAVLAGSANDNQYLTNVTVGGENFTVIVDTGSSDTWVAQKGFECFNLTSFPEKQSYCAFGSSGFDESKSKTFASYPDKNFNITYGDGEFLNGPVGFDTVIIGDMAVNKQEIGLVNKAAWNGDGINSGLLGLAYPELTSVYNGTDPDSDVSGESDTYNPLFFTALSERVVSNPYFSVALNRGSFKHQENSSYDTNLGYLAFGGIAPVNTTNISATIPVQGYTLKSGLSNQYLFYTVEIDSYIFNGSAAPTGSGKQAILDTGTTLNYLPNALAKAYNSKFVPPATYVADQDTYFVDCNATVPAFSVNIGGTKFTIDAADNILPAGTDSNGNELCVSGTQNGGDPSDTDLFILGDVFLHNVVVTFNVQSNKITITQRTAY